MSDYLTDGGDVSEPEQPSEVYGDAVRAEEVRTHYRSVHHHLMIFTTSSSRRLCGLPTARKKSPLCTHKQEKVLIKTFRTGFLSFSQLRIGGVVWRLGAGLMYKNWFGLVAHYVVVHIARNFQESQKAVSVCYSGNVQKFVHPNHKPKKNSSFNQDVLMHSVLQMIDYDHKQHKTTKSWHTFISPSFCSLIIS